LRTPSDWLDAFPRLAHATRALRMVAAARLCEALPAAAIALGLEYCAAYSAI
jgi:hypothetical protein